MPSKRYYKKQAEELRDSLDRLRNAKEGPIPEDTLEALHEWLSRVVFYQMPWGFGFRDTYNYARLLMELEIYRREKSQGGK